MNATPGLFAAASGDAGPWIVLLHGFGGSHAVWRRIASRLQGMHRLLAYDLPGHGRSRDFPDAGPPKVAVRAVLEDLDARGLTKVHLAGHSMGGAVATLVALARPDRVASLSLLSPGGFGETINAALLRRFASARTREDIADCLAGMRAPGSSASPVEVADIATERADPQATPILTRIAAAMTRADRQGAIPRESLAGISVPTTVGWGRQDPVLPVEQALALPDNLAVQLFEKAGHMLPDECPAAMAQLIADTVRTAERASA